MTWGRALNKALTRVLNKLLVAELALWTPGGLPAVHQCRAVLPSTSVAKIVAGAFLQAARQM